MTTYTNDTTSLAGGNIAVMATYVGELGLNASVPHAVIQLTDNAQTIAEKLQAEGELNITQCHLCLAPMGNQIAIVCDSNTYIKGAAAFEATVAVGRRPKHQDATVRGLLNMKAEGLKVLISKLGLPSASQSATLLFGSFWSDNEGKTIKGGIAKMGTNCSDRSKPGSDSSICFSYKEVVVNEKGHLIIPKAKFETVAQNVLYQMQVDDLIEDLPTTDSESSEQSARNLLALFSDMIPKLRAQGRAGDGYFMTRFYVCDIAPDAKGRQRFTMTAGNSETGAPPDMWYLEPVGGRLESLSQALARHHLPRRDGLSNYTLQGRSVDDIVATCGGTDPVQKPTPMHHLSMRETLHKARAREARDVWEINPEGKRVRTARVHVFAGTSDAIASTNGFLAHEKMLQKAREVDGLRGMEDGGHVFGTIVCASNRVLQPLPGVFDTPKGFYSGGEMMLHTDRIVSEEKQKNETVATKGYASTLGYALGVSPPDPEAPDEEKERKIFNALGGVFGSSKEEHMRKLCLPCRPEKCAHVGSDGRNRCTNKPMTEEDPDRHSHEYVVSCFCETHNRQHGNPHLGDDMMMINNGSKLNQYLRFGHLLGCIVEIMDTSAYSFDRPKQTISNDGAGWASPEHLIYEVRCARMVFAQRHPSDEVANNVGQIEQAWAKQTIFARRRKALIKAQEAHL
jgi:hypothetical protein